MTDIEQTIIDFIRVELLEDPQFDLTPTDQILLDDIVDSMGVMRLVEFIEERGKVTVPAEDVTIDNFATVAIMAGYIRGRNIAFA